MSEDQRRLVADGYDRMASTYEDWVGRISGSPTRRLVEDLLARLPERATVLELGCGGGFGETALLAEHADLTGVDISAEQVARARERLPGATFLRADLAEIDFAPGSFDAVVALHVLNHVPQAELRRLPARVHAWLRAGGYFLASYGASEPHESIEDGWLGVPMFFASVGLDENRANLAAAGFELVTDEVVPEHEPEGDVRFHWLLARKL